MLRGHIGSRLENSDVDCLDGCTACSNCKDGEVNKCSSVLDINNNPYQCLPEDEAVNWHKKCLPMDGIGQSLCQYTGK